MFCWVAATVPYLLTDRKMAMQCSKTTYMLKSNVWMLFSECLSTFPLSQDISFVFLFCVHVIRKCYSLSSVDPSWLNRLANQFTILINSLFLSSSLLERKTRVCAFTSVLNINVYIAFGKMAHGSFLHSIKSQQL